MSHCRASMLCAAALALAACRVTPGIPGPARISTGTNASLRAFIDSMTDAPQFSDAHWGILIV
ncbi:MAG TPA: hypothetical protein VFS57_07160, partial [Gemmatimonadaceae bacterium]|nr:hypothetical protein [Gemmatimonadaceae bacterium]